MLHLIPKTAIRDSGSCTTRQTVLVIIVMVNILNHSFFFLPLPPSPLALYYVILHLKFHFRSKIHVSIFLQLFSRYISDGIVP